MSTNSTTVQSVLRERGSNPRPKAYEAFELPLLYPTIYASDLGIEPSCLTLTACRLNQLSYSDILEELLGLEPKLKD